MQDIFQLRTLADLKNFVNGLTEEQLQQPLRSWEEEQPLHQIANVQILPCDLIDAGGDCLEPINDYLPGGDSHEEEYDPTDAPVGVPGGTIIFNVYPLDVDAFNFTD